MNIDLLTKLVRLANNNPNDNEANLAARRACKLIEEGKFNFGVNTSKPTTKPPPNVRPQTQYENPFDVFARYARAQQQYNPYTQPNPRCKNCGAELKEQWLFTEEYCQICKANRAKEQSKQHEKYTETDWSKIKFDFDDHRTYRPASKPAENITVKCLFCKQDFKRKEFRTDFICHACYVRKNKSEKPPVKNSNRTYYKSVFCFACGHGFSVTYTELTADLVGQITGNCEKCNEPYIRATK